MDMEVKKLGTIIGFAVAGVVALVVGMGSFYTIDAGERGVILRNGAIADVAEPGLGFKVPLIDDVKKIPVQTYTQVYENLAAYSFDQQPAELRISVSFSLKPDQVANIYENYGSLEGVVNRLIDRQVNEQVRIVFGRFTAIRAVQDREKLAQDIQQAVIDNIGGPVNVATVQLENIDFSTAYENSIEQRMLAEVEVQQVRQNAERERVSAEIAVIKAKAEAEARLAQAEAEAKAITLRGDAEASAIKARGEALRANPEMVALTAAERWDGNLPQTMVPGGAVPFLDLSSKLESEPVQTQPAISQEAPLKALPAPVQQ